VKIPDDAPAARYKQSYEKMVGFFGRLYRAGVPLVAGTDEFTGFVLQRKPSLCAGWTNSRSSLQVATWTGAK